jgi:hypothetical protein
VRLGAIRGDPAAAGQQVRPAAPVRQALPAQPALPGEAVGLRYRTPLLDPLRSHDAVYFRMHRILRDRCWPCSV